MTLTGLECCLMIMASSAARMSSGSRSRAHKIHWKAYELTESSWQHLLLDCCDVNVSVVVMALLSQCLLDQCVNLVGPPRVAEQCLHQLFHFKMAALVTYSLSFFLQNFVLFRFLLMTWLQGLAPWLAFLGARELRPTTNSSSRDHSKELSGNTTRGTAGKQLDG